MSSLQSIQYHGRLIVLVVRAHHRHTARPERPSRQQNRQSVVSGWIYNRVWHRGECPVRRPLIKIDFNCLLADGRAPRIPNQYQRIVFGAAWFGNLLFSWAVVLTRSRGGKVVSRISQWLWIPHECGDRRWQEPDTRDWLGINTASLLPSTLPLKSQYRPHPCRPHTAVTRLPCLLCPTLHLIPQGIVPVIYLLPISWQG